jgi:serine/threonine protein kinase
MQSTLAPRPLLTEPGHVVGTVAYMSPEQLRGEELDGRTDLFSLGLVLYEMATGRAAFVGATSAVISAAILHTTPLTPRAVRPDLAEALERVIVKGIEKDRHPRYQHASDIRVDLQRLKGDTNPVATSRRPSPLLKYGIAAVAVLILVAGVVLLRPQRTLAKPLTDKDVLVLADFVNTTGEPLFDGTLRQGLAFQLEQSPFLKIMNDEQVQRDLRLMNLPPAAPITNQIAHDICVRDAAAATIDGSITSLGKNYVVNLQAITCGSVQRLPGSRFRRTTRSTC